MMKKNTKLIYLFTSVAPGWYGSNNKHKMAKNWSGPNADDPKTLWPVDA